jgi:hypothetical protein
MTSNCLGATVVTRRGTVATVERIEEEHVVIRVPDGLRRIPLGSVAQWFHPFPVGSIVHKRRQRGWIGVVTKLIGPDFLEVVWWLETFPARVSIENLALADDEFTKRYRIAFGG